MAKIELIRPAGFSLGRCPALRLPFDSATRLARMLLIKQTLGVCEYNYFDSVIFAFKKLDLN